MKTLLIVLITLLLAVPAFAGETEEFTLTVSGSLEVPLSYVFNHYSITTDTDIGVRFIIPTLAADGSVYSFTARPRGNPAIPYGSGPRPDLGDTLITIIAASGQNILNDIPARKILFTGSGTVTVKAKE